MLATMLKPAPTFHVHAIALAVGAVVLLNLPMMKVVASLTFGIAITLAAISVVYAIAAFTERAITLASGIIAGLALIIGVTAGLTGLMELFEFRG